LTYWPQDDISESEKVYIQTLPLYNKTMQRQCNEIDTKINLRKKDDPICEKKKTKQPCKVTHTCTLKKKNKGGIILPKRPVPCYRNTGCAESTNRSAESAGRGAESAVEGNAI
jgi:hypothetical protein